MVAYGSALSRTTTEEVDLSKKVRVFARCAQVLTLRGRRVHALPATCELGTATAACDP
jgi:hypothetical protein